MMNHLGDAAALYALGALESQELAAFDEHLEGCDACRRLLAQAQADVAAMVAAQEQLEAPDALRERIARSLASASGPQGSARAGIWAALAAAVVIAFLPAFYMHGQNVAMQQALATDAQAMIRVATSPHRTASFAGTDARVMYGPDGSWYCIVVRGASAPLHVVWPHDGRQTMLGTAVPHGSVALLYLPQSHRMDELSLMVGDRVVGQAQLVF
jgi:hypothetical protein